MAKTSSGGETIVVKVSKDLHDQLVALRDEQGVNLSVVVRMLLETSLGTPAKNAVAREAIWFFAGKIKRAFHEATPEILDLLESRIESSLNE